MIVVDSSALVAVMLDEPLGPAMVTCLSSAPACFLSVANYVETGQVMTQRSRRGPQAELDRFHQILREFDIQLVPVDEDQARVALDARIRFGRGFGHRAHLNYSDCFAYALAKTRGLPLLFVGDDFTHTDIVSALA
ncbi:MAG TPA: type II toxin-antitoxin system VapC family toxin [Caulobacteraceae bacterium]